MERFGWTLLLLMLISYGAGLLYLLGFIVQVVSAVTSIGSRAPVLLQLRPSFTIPAAHGTHSYSGSAYIADGATVTATGASAAVSGIDPLTRVLLQLDPLLWSVTLCIVTVTIAVTLARLRARDTARLASRPMRVAALVLGVGSTAAQLAHATATVRIGHVAWEGSLGITGFDAAPSGLFDFTPIGVAVAFLAIVLVLRRSETTALSAAPRDLSATTFDRAGVNAARANAEGPRWLALPRSRR